MVNWFVQTVRIFVRFSIQTIRTLNFIFVSALQLYKALFTSLNTLYCGGEPEQH